MEGRNKPMAERTGSTKGKKSMSFATISGAQQTWQDPLLALSQSKMT
jgi:hypothetical protein